MTRLLFGDCLERMGEIADGSVDLIACDLPYGTTACKWDVVIPFEPLWAAYRRLLKPGGAVVLTATQPFSSALVMSNPEWFRYQWVWIRGKRATGHLDIKRRPLRRHEVVLIFGGKPPVFRPVMGEGPLRKSTSNKGSRVYRAEGPKIPYCSTARYPTDVIEIDADDARLRVHPTQKPVALFEYLIKTYSNPGELVLDNAMGSGTTGVACARTSRDFIGIEKDPGFFGICESRINEALAIPA